MSSIQARRTEEASPIGPEGCITECSHPMFRKRSRRLPACSHSFHEGCECRRSSPTRRGSLLVLRSTSYEAHPILYMPAMPLQRDSCHHGARDPALTWHTGSQRSLVKVADLELQQRADVGMRIARGTSLLYKDLGFSHQVSPTRHSAQMSAAATHASTLTRCLAPIWVANAQCQSDGNCICASMWHALGNSVKTAPQTDNLAEPVSGAPFPSIKICDRANLARERAGRSPGRLARYLPAGKGCSSDTRVGRRLLRALCSSTCILSHILFLHRPPSTQLMSAGTCRLAA